MFSLLFLSTLAQTAASQTSMVLTTKDSSPDDVMCKDSTIPIVSNIITREDMETVFIIYEDEQDACVNSLIDSISHHTKIQYTQQDALGKQLTSVISELVLKENIDIMRRTLNFVMLCSAQCIQYALATGHEVDVKVGRKSVLRHFSKWIALSSDDTSILVQHQTFDNIVLLSQSKNSTKKELSTLMWAAGGRRWDVLDSGSTISISNITLFPNMAFGLNGRKLLVVSLEWKPYSVKVRDTGNISYTGISDEFMEHLSVRFNFSYQYVEPADGQWGEKMDNGSYTGIVGTLQREEADICSVPYAYNVERAKVMQFTYFMHSGSTTVMYKKSEDANKTWKVLIACFKWEVYIVGGIVLSVVGLMHIFLVRTTPYPSKILEAERKSSLIAGFTMSITAPLAQSSTHSPVFDSGRMLFSFWWLFCLVMAAVYRGNLMAFLTVSRTFVPFRSIEELANQDVYDVGSTAGTYHSLAIQTSNQTVMKKLWKKIEKTRQESPANRDAEHQFQLQRLHEGYYALIETSTLADNIMSDTCSLARMREGFLPSTGGMTFPVYSPLARLFYLELMTVMEAGLERKWYSKWVPSQDSCSDDSIAVGVSALRIQDYYSALAACVVGIGAALLVLLGETYISELLPRTESKRSRDKGPG
ncbi:probable glutamate receptor [Haliotis rubra]|uniref:probable glutamate receptor n=1 Tax=Haliotis rubra TaxID=36100 RepID=UPI001EE62382|nr:probable glutamate receptor [Haliotis rubra]